MPEHQYWNNQPLCTVNSVQLNRSQGGVVDRVRAVVSWILTSVLTVGGAAVIVQMNRTIATPISVASETAPSTVVAHRAASAKVRPSAPVTPSSTGSAAVHSVSSTATHVTRKVTKAPPNTKQPVTPVDVDVTTPPVTTTTVAPVTTATTPPTTVPPPPPPVISPPVTTPPVTTTTNPGRGDD